MNSNVNIIVDYHPPSAFYLPTSTKDIRHFTVHFILPI